jgi:Uma2 family endonuclease
MATNTVEPAVDDARDDCVVMYAIGWDGYTRVLRARGERPRPNMVYLDGNLYLMSPAYPHEFLKKRLGHFVMVVVEELDIPCTPAGETTFRRRKKEAGAEPDESFYLANEPRIRGKQRQNLRLRRDPPPDLVIESVNTHEADEAIEVWRRFRVPEVWVCDVDALRILTLQANRRYAEVPNSVAFPFLTAAEVFEWVSRPQTGSETDWLKQLRAWVRDVLAPRARGGG